ncbi:hypothetical protein NEHOM01_2052 [Nematocida homosporus]|uniref:uncharacterized protein n=1 Tax=Nematocida homosporus TaxID=1912981 RepID=UPI002220B559|nr:uncharacterized protein NEHOM01_2052 [Nematocida homosporus]KAI5187261.1 hypothetical protein NEHOM01_2052 [Nematocida homosporus]
MMSIRISKAVITIVLLICLVDRAVAGSEVAQRLRALFGRLARQVPLGPAAGDSQNTTWSSLKKKTLAGATLSRTYAHSTATNWSLALNIEQAEDWIELESRLLSEDKFTLPNVSLIDCMSDGRASPVEARVLEEIIRQLTGTEHLSLVGIQLQDESQDLSRESSEPSLSSQTDLSSAASGLSNPIVTQLDPKFVLVRALTIIHSEAVLIDKVLGWVDCARIEVLSLHDCLATSTSFLSKYQWPQLRRLCIVASPQLQELDLRMLQNTSKVELGLFDIPAQAKPILPPTALSCSQLATDRSFLTRLNSLVELKQCAILTEVLEIDLSIIMTQPINYNSPSSSLLLSPANLSPSTLTFPIANPNKCLVAAKEIIVWLECRSGYPLSMEYIQTDCLTTLSIFKCSAPHVSVLYGVTSKDGLTPRIYQINGSAIVMEVFDRNSKTKEPTIRERLLDVAHGFCC